MKSKEYWQSMRAADFEKLSQNPTFKQYVSGVYTVWVWEENGKPYLKAFTGKAGRYFEYYYYRTIEQRSERLNKLLESGKQIADYKAKSKAENKGKPSEHALVSNIIKKTLAKLYPDVKFSVRSESYSGGDSVHVAWIDGPTSEQIDTLISKYQEGYFDGMEDLYHYTPRNSINENGKIEKLPGVKYVSPNRSLSKEVREKLTNEVIKRFGINPNDPNDAHNKLGTWLDNYVYRISCKMDFTKISIDELVKLDDFVNFDNAEKIKRSPELKIQPIENYFQVLKQIEKALDRPQHVKLTDGKQYFMDSGTAKLILQIEKSLTGEIKDKFHEALCTSSGLMKIVSLVWKHASFN